MKMTSKISSTPRAFKIKPPAQIQCRHRAPTHHSISITALWSHFGCPSLERSISSSVHKSPVCIYPFLPLFSTLPGLLLISWHFFLLGADAISLVWTVLPPPVEIFISQGSANHHTRNAQIHPFATNHLFFSCPPLALCFCFTLWQFFSCFLPPLDCKLLKMLHLSLWLWQ